MSLVGDVTGIGAIATLIDDGINKIWPNKTDQEKAQAAQLMAELNAKVELAKAQIATNTAEAGNGSVFVAGARPFMLWVCGAAFAWSYVAAPLLAFILAAAGHVVPLPKLDMAEMMPVVLGMLGFGTMRTTEKLKGVNHLHG